MSHGLFQAFQVCTHNSSHKQTERRDREISLFFYFLFSFQLVGSGAYPLPPPGSGGEAVGVHRGGRQHVRDGVGTIKTEKSGFTVAVTLPILPVLARTLEAGPCGDLTFIAGERGQPLTKESFGNVFRDACRAANVPGSAHGMRKIAATRAANHGATVAQLEAIFGWSGGTMASHYTRSADRQRLAFEAMHKLANDERTSIPAPDGQVRARSEKNK